jgi:hypothetical protein
MIARKKVGFIEVGEIVIADGATQVFVFLSVY